MRALQRHNQRENKNYSNKDIDPSRSHLNYDLINPTKINYTQKVEERIAEGYTGKRKIRSDAVKLIDGIITSDKAFFDRLTEKQQEQFFKDSLDFLKKEYGEKNIIYATVHLDEKTPHMHFGFVPLTEDGRLSARDVLGNKKSLSILQDRFNKYINEKGYNLERGKKATGRKHIELQEFKLKTLEDKVKQKAEEAEQIQSKIEKYRRDFEKLQQVDQNIRQIEDIENKATVKRGILTKEATVTLKKEDFDLYSSVAKSGFAYYEKYEELKRTNSEVVQELQKENDELEADVKQLMEQNMRLSRENQLLREENNLLRENLELHRNVIQTFIEKVRDYTKKLAEMLKMEKLYDYFIKHVLERAKDETLQQARKELNLEKEQQKHDQEEISL